MYVVVFVSLISLSRAVKDLARTELLTLSFPRVARKTGGHGRKVVGY